LQNNPSMPVAPPILYVSTIKGEKMRKYSICTITSIAILLLSACSSESGSTLEHSPHNPAAAQAFANVISDHLPFTFFGFAGSPFSDWMFGSDLLWATPTFDSLLFSEYFEKPEVIYTWEIVSFAFVDLGQDGNMQLVLRSDADGDFLILHYMGDGVVYGFGIPGRQFQSLKVDGTFLQLSWMQEWGAIARLNFYPENETRVLDLILLHEWEQGLHHEGLLFLDGEYVDFEEGWAMVENIRYKHGSKESVTWYPFEELDLHGN